jgi:hypothetical protein
MKVRVLLLAAVVAVASVFAATTAAPSSAAGTGIAVPISTTQSGGTLNGVFTVTSFSLNQAGQLVANGTFVGTALINGVVTPVSTAASAVAAAPAACRILGLTLGPLHLDLLGLVVDLNQVNLLITAVPGPGNLLGNLLCAVAHLLDNTSVSPTAAQQLVALLNFVLARL